MNIAYGFHTEDVADAARGTCKPIRGAAGNGSAAEPGKEIKNEREDHADEDRGAEREVHRDVLAAICKVTR